MKFAKVRLVAILIMIVFAAITWWNWHLLFNEGRYYIKAAAFGPVGVVGGFFMLLFPTMAGKPSTTKEKVITLAVFGVGIIVGLINWYLMDPQFFFKI
ncbi:MAG: hypothetical protein QOH96_175 [Blastocatellia bacterium]|jgi:hypothetical protein|nr:hypothetical protein [Blastocatellia bacterium]